MPFGSISGDLKLPCGDFAPADDKFNRIVARRPIAGLLPAEKISIPELIPVGFDIGGDRLATKGPACGVFPESGNHVFHPAARWLHLGIELPCDEPGVGTCKAVAVPALVERQQLLRAFKKTNGSGCR